MSLATLTFKIFTDPGVLASAYSGTTLVQHNSDLSDTATDVQLTLGSTASSLKLETQTNPGVNSIFLTPTVLRSEWQATTAYILGNSVEPVTPNGLRYEVTTAGTTGGSEPTFPTVGFGSTVLDGTVVWTLIAQAHPTTELKIATLEAGLPGATGGAALDMGTTILSGTSNDFEFWIRITNTVTEVSDTIGIPGIGFNINAIKESNV